MKDQVKFGQEIGGVKESPYLGTTYETEMDGVAMDKPAQDLLNGVGLRGLKGWELKGIVPVPAQLPPGTELPEGAEPDMVWGLIYQRPKSALVRV